MADMVVSSSGWGCDGTTGGQQWLPGPNKSKENGWKPKKTVGWLFFKKNNPMIAGWNLGFDG